jgi:hypothetical protein
MIYRGPSGHMIRLLAHLLPLPSAKVVSPSQSSCMLLVLLINVRWGGGVRGRRGAKSDDREKGPGPL